jgi:hypothetical protein
MTYEEIIERHNADAGNHTKPRHEESRLQRACVQWFRLQYPAHTLFAIPNGGKRNAREAGILKAEGVLPGVADLFLMYPNKGYMSQYRQRGYRGANI